ncbi:hypothetical protein V2J09_022657 [Rumex salicifolius]
MRKKTEKFGVPAAHLHYISFSFIFYSFHYRRVKNPNSSIQSQPRNLSHLFLSSLSISKPLKSLFERDLSFDPSTDPSISPDKKAGKDQKISSKASSTVNGTSGLSSSAYNPVLGTFLTLETSPISSLTSLHVNGRFRNIDETDENSGVTHLSGREYDSASNNDSHSVESEEHKDKASGRQEVIPGADNDKRDKIRQKNERKHQRQKEKRAQELHERCRGYLMSRKLEALSQKLVSMGFPAEQSTMALILNEGILEEAVSWLTEDRDGSDKNKDQNLDTGGNLKIDISEELAQIAELEVSFKCSKQEVERAVVACEGDLVKAKETLQEQKQDPPCLPSKQEDTGDPSTLSNGKISLATSQNPVGLQQRPSPISVIQPSSKIAVAAGPAPKIVNKSVLPTKIQQKLEWAKPQQMTILSDKRWPAGALATPSVSYSLASPLQASSPPTKADSRYVPMTAANEYKNVHPGTTVTEQLVMMQRPQSLDSRVMAAINTSNSSSPPRGSPSWYPSSSEMLKPNGALPYIPTTRSLSPNDLTSNHQLFQQTQYQQNLHHQFGPGTSQVDMQGASRAQAMWKRAGSSPTLAVASSLGLFSGVGSTCSSGSSSPVDWHTGGTMSSCDYNNIDWSLDRTFLPSMSKTSNGLWQGLSAPYHQKSSAQNMYDAHATVMDMRQAMRQPSSNGNGVSIASFQNGGSGMADKASAGSREWTSPFEGNDLFSSHRQFVSSPSR